MNTQNRLLYPINKEMEPVGKIDLKFFNDLKLDSVFFRSNQRKSIPMCDYEELFTTDEEVCRYRMEIMEDMLNQPQFDELLERVLPEIESMYELRKAKGSIEDLEANLYSLKEIETYIKLVELLGSSIQSMNFNSQGLGWFQERIVAIYTSEEFDKLKKNSKEMVNQIGRMRSITLGVNIDTSCMAAKEVGVLSINSECFKSGDIIDRLLSARLKRDEHTCLTPLVSSRSAESGTSALLQTVNEAITRIYKKSFQSFSSSVRNYVKCNTDFLVQNYSDLMFFHKSYQLLMELRKKGYPICKPDIAPKEEKAFQANNMYNVVLALKSNDHVVTNSITFDDQGRFFLITGPNHGGKSIFAYSVGMMQAMAQLGLLVPASSARISLVDHIFTHFPNENQDELGKGRFGEECERLSEILAKCSEYSMILMDESFSSTSNMEGTYIGKEVLLSIAAIGCRGCFVTHMHDLCNQVEEINKNVEHRIMIDNLVAEIDEDSTNSRSYRILRTKPNGLSYAKDIARKYGLVYEDIMKRHR